jgi:hypothetical protein
MAKDILDKIRLLVSEETKYQKLFKKKLKEYGVTSPAELKGHWKKKFFNDMDKEWKAKKETD